MHVLKKAGISLALSLSLISLAQADATLTIGSSGSNQYAWLNSGSFEIGRVTFEYGTQSITALQTSVTLKDQGWGGQDPSNGVYVQLLSNNNAVYGFNVAGATHDWQTLNFNLALAGIDRANGPISLQFVTNAWGYPGWELHTLNNSLSVTTSLQAVPEPETYAMLLLGLGAIGWVSRRKTRATA